MKVAYPQIFLISNRYVNLRLRVSISRDMLKRCLTLSPPSQSEPLVLDARSPWLRFATDALDVVAWPCWAASGAILADQALAAYLGAAHEGHFILSNGEPGLNLLPHGSCFNFLMGRKAEICALE